MKNEALTVAETETEAAAPEWKGDLIWNMIGIGTFLLVLVLDKLIFTDLIWWGRLCLYLIPYLLLGREILEESVENIKGGEFLDENILMVIATVGALCVGEYPEAVFVLLFFNVGELFEHIAVGKSRKNIADLMELAPKSATVIRDGVPVVVKPEDIAVGEEILVKAGERVALDGVVIAGSASLDTAALTGESAPRGATVGDAVPGGCFSLDGGITLRVTNRYADSTLSKIMQTVENATENGTDSEKFITRFSKIYTPVVVGAALLLAVLPPLIFQQTFTVWVYRALTFLVVSCPCALVISIPLAYFAGIGQASRIGVLVKGSCYLEILANSHTVVFDKTGTLTKGNFEVADVFPADGISAEELLTCAALAESSSNHPIARALKKRAPMLNMNRLGELSERAGFGICAVIDGVETYVGNDRWMAENAIAFSICHEIGTPVYVAQKGRYLGCILIRDEIKEQAKETVAALKHSGITKTVMLTGDKESVAQDVAAQVGIDEVRAGLLPDEKATAVEALMQSSQKNKKLIFVGDGINDAPVMLTADAGVAMGAFGADVAIEAADVVLMNDNPFDLVRGIRTARRTQNIVRQNVTFILIVKFAVLFLSAIGLAPMYLAIFADVGTLILSILNSMRIFTRKTK